MNKMITIFCIILGVILIVGVSVACHSKAASAPDSPTNNDEKIHNATDITVQEKQAEPEIDIPDFDLQKENEWVTYYEDSQLGTTRYFDAAAQIIRKEVGVDGKISPFRSKHFANWYLISFEFEFPYDEGKLDGEISQDMAYLLDLGQKKIIARNQFSEILPLVVRVIELAHTSSESSRDTLIYGLATAISALASGNSDCYDNPGDELHPKATLESLDDHNHIIKYYTVSGAQALPVFDLCTVTISDSGITFDSKRLD